MIDREPQTRNAEWFQRHLLPAEAVGRRVDEKPPRRWPPPRRFVVLRSPLIIVVVVLSLAAAAVLELDRQIGLAIERW